MDLYIMLRGQLVHVRSGKPRNFPGFNVFSVCFFIPRNIMLELLSDIKTWEKFYEYKTSLACPKEFTDELRKFIDSRSFQRICEAIDRGDPFPHPRKSVISKLNSSKKRTVYIYPHDENIVFKLLTYLLLRKYDSLFDSGLYSFRPGLSAKDAVRSLRRVRGIGKMYSYKVDIHDYFNSIPVARLIPMLNEILADDPKLCDFLTNLLADPYVIDRGKTVMEQKGIMAGTPLSSFYANIYMRALDHHFAALGVPYARYSDDIIVFAPSKEETEQYAATIRAFLGEYGLCVNPDKEQFSSPEDGWTFLGFSVKGNVVDIAPATVLKLKGKMRRKAAGLLRWRLRNEVSGEKAAAAFIRIFNRKLLEGPKDNELTWSYWFFPVINSSKSLRVIDNYAQECIRYIISGKRTKARFNVRYEDIKKLGYRNLVHAYYDYNHSSANSKPSPSQN